MKKQKDKYPFLVRLFIGVPTIILASLMWSIIWCVSTKSLSEVLEKTANNLK